MDAVVNRAQKCQIDTPNERKMKMYEPPLIDFSWSKHMLERTTDPEPARRTDPNFTETVSHTCQTQQDEKKWWFNRLSM